VVSIAKGIGIGIGLALGVWSTQPAWAHSGAPPAPHDLWQSWNFEPLVVMLLLCTGLLYGRGVVAIWRSAGPGRGVRPWQVICFGSGLAALALALISPVDAVGSALFSVHMVQHVLLMDVAAPLLVLGMPPVLPLWVAPRVQRRPLAGWWQRQHWLHRLWRWLRSPLVVWSLNGLTLWIWHAPRFYEAALENEAIHIFEHFTFLSTALLFWWVLVYRRQSGLRTEIALLMVFTTALHSGMLGALLTFAPRPLYRSYLPTAPQWGISALTDQQLAGTIMWIPIGFLYLGTMVLLLAQWLKQMDWQAKESIG
jgi:putative membrane protein